MQVTEDRRRLTFEQTELAAMSQNPDEESEAARNEAHRRAGRRHWTFEKIAGGIALFFTAVAAGGAILAAIFTGLQLRRILRESNSALMCF
jgi:hypothetical protein